MKFGTQAAVVFVEEPVEGSATTNHPVQSVIEGVCAGNSGCYGYYLSSANNFYYVLDNSDIKSTYTAGVGNTQRVWKKYEAAIHIRSSCTSQYWHLCSHGYAYAMHGFS